MTETVAVAEDLPAEPEPSPRMTLEELQEKLPSPLAEEILAGHPDLHLALWNSEDLAELVALPVIITDEVRAAWRAADEELACDIDKYRAEAVLGQSAALRHVDESLRPVPAYLRPGPHLQLADPLPEDEAAKAAALAEHQQASDADLGRWTGGKAIADDKHTDEAATRFLDAFQEDPEGDEDRAPLPEVHHEGGEA